MARAVDRIVRWENRLSILMESDTIFDRDAGSYADDFHACFVECYHMKDWLINDPEFDRATNKEIEEYVSDTPSLQFCADLANLKKHLNLKSNRHKAGKIQGIRFAFVVSGVSDEVGADDPESESLNADAADSVKANWIKCGMDPKKITIQIFGDVNVDGDWGFDEFGGCFGLAKSAVNAWREFVDPDPSR